MKVSFPASEQYGLSISERLTIARTDDFRADAKNNFFSVLAALNIRKNTIENQD